MISCLHASPFFSCILSLPPTSPNAAYIFPPSIYQLLSPLIPSSSHSPSFLSYLFFPPFPSKFTPTLCFTCLKSSSNCTCTRDFVALFQKLCSIMLTNLSTCPPTSNLVYTIHYDIDLSTYSVQPIINLLKMLSLSDAILL